MNKYLEKVAERFELEPGVFYDKTKHDITLSRDKGNQEADAADTRKRLGWGAYGGVVGGALGAAAGHGVSGVHIRRAEPWYSVQWVDPSDEAVAAWEASKPIAPDIKKYHPGGLEFDEGSGRLEFKKRHPEWEKYHADSRRWLNTTPRGDYKEVLNQSSVKPSIVNKLADKIGPGAARRVFTGAGLAAGGLGIGGLYYAFNSATPAERTAAKDAYITKALKRHDSTIHQLEGWE